MRTRLTETEVVDLLSRLEAGWPPDLFLMVDGQAHLMRTAPGEHPLDNRGGHADQKEVVRIRCDGGDPW